MYLSLTCSPPLLFKRFLVSFWLTPSFLFLSFFQSASALKTKNTNIVYSTYLCVWGWTLKKVFTCHSHRSQVAWTGELVPRVLIWQSCPGSDILLVCFAGTGEGQGNHKHWLAEAVVAPGVLFSRQQAFGKTCSNSQVLVKGPDLWVLVSRHKIKGRDTHELL